MLTTLRRLKNALVWLLELTVIVLVAGLVADVLWQVFTRYALRRPSSWTDELATLLIIWVALLGSSVAFIRQSHLGVDVLVSKLAPPARAWVDLAVHLLIALFAAAILIVGGLKLMALAFLTDQVSPALGLRMGQVYLALPLSGGFIFVFALETMAECAMTLHRLRKEGL